MENTCYNCNRTHVNCIETDLRDCFVLEPQVFEDNRGLFLESYHKEKFEQAIHKKIDFVQDNLSVSKRGVLRGLHFQEKEYAQAKLVHVVKGKVLDVVVDVRQHSETFGKHIKLELSENNRKMIFIPKGMAHGFLTLSESALFAYKCDEYYNKASENGILYNDLTLNIDWNWPENELILSQKDKELPSFKELFP